MTGPALHLLRPGSAELTLLLIEPDPQDARIVQRMLAATDNHGFHVIHAASLERALELLPSVSFDAVVANVRLPGVSGPLAVRRLQSAAPTLPVVVLSALDDEPLAIEAVQAGAQDYLLKRHGDGRSLSRAILYAIERKRAERCIYRLAHYDSVTELPNRMLFHDRLEQALQRADREGRSVALLYLDLDGFKQINDTLGPSLGDLLLRGVAGRLRSRIREGDTVGRIGGDEFAFVLPGIRDAEAATRFADGIVEALAMPFQISGHELFVGTSIGIGLYPGDGKHAGFLMENADAALQRAKHMGGNNTQRYVRSMNRRASEQLALGNALRRAIDREELRLHFQPQFCGATGRVTGMEALIRWEHPERGLLSPMQFIPMAEETGLIVPIGEWVLHEACMQTRRWREQGLPLVPMAVNLSNRQLLRDDFAATVRQALEQARLEPQCLELEVAETSMMRNEERTLRALQEVHEQGVRVSMDDFGTGYASLSHLKRFPVDTLKIDKSFVLDITNDPGDAAIVKGIISIAHGLGQRVIAEGVETCEQLEFLQAHRCDQMQGFYFSHPRPADQLLALLARGTALSAPERALSEV